MQCYKATRKTRYILTNRRFILKHKLRTKEKHMTRKKGVHSDVPTENEILAALKTLGGKTAPEALKLELLTGPFYARHNEIAMQRSVCRYGTDTKSTKHTIQEAA